MWVCRGGGGRGGCGGWGGECVLEPVCTDTDGPVAMVETIVSV